MKLKHHIIKTAQVCDRWCQESRMYDRVLPLAFLLGVFIFLVYFVTVAPPLSFPTASLYKVQQGATIDEVAQGLKAKHLIHSTLLFEAVERWYGADSHVIAGEYFFSGPQNLFTIASRLVHGDHELVPVRVTIPEGATAKDISQILSQKIADFDTPTFIKDALPEEGRLFPDTYFIFPGEDPDLVLSTFTNNFAQHIRAPQIQTAIAAFGKPLPDVLTMASLLEKEAPDTKNRQLIAGLLWHRISIGMALQVDAVFPYIIGVNSLQLTKVQLQTDSLYNTYTHKGLPPGPIANPSLDSILDAVTPTKSNYLFYLSDLHGTMHYCATYACQLANQKKYLGS